MHHEGWGFIWSLWVNAHYLWLSSTPCHSRVPSLHCSHGKQEFQTWAVHVAPCSQTLGKQACCSCCAWEGRAITSPRVSTNCRQGPEPLLFMLSGFSDKLTQLLKINCSLLRFVGTMLRNECAEIWPECRHFWGTLISFFPELKTFECIVKENYLCRKNARRRQKENLDICFIWTCVQIYY